MWYGAYSTSCAPASRLGRWRLVISRQMRWPALNRVNWRAPCASTSPWGAPGAHSAAYRHWLNETVPIAQPRRSATALKKRAPSPTEDKESRATRKDKHQVFPDPKLKPRQNNSAPGWLGRGNTWDYDGAGRLVGYTGRPVQVCPVMPDLVEPYTRRACSTHFTFQAASHSTFAIAGVASLSLAHGGRGECRRAAGPRGDPAKRRKIGLSLDTRG